MPKNPNNNINVNIFDEDGKNIARVQANSSNKLNKINNEENSEIDELRNEYQKADTEDQQAEENLNTQENLANQEATDEADENPEVAEDSKSEVDNSNLENEELPENNNLNKDNINNNERVINRKNPSQIEDNENKENIQEEQQVQNDELEDDLGKGPEYVQKASKYIEEKAETLRKVAKTSGCLVRFFVNPITWGAILLIIIVMAFNSGASIIGKNDYNIMCESNGVGSVEISDDADAFTRQSAIAAWLTSTPFDKLGGKPMSREQAMGVIGNISQESYQGNPKTIQNDHAQTKWKTCDNNCVLAWGTEGGRAIGIIQWDTLRRVDLVNFAKSEGTQWYDLNTQLKFLKGELDGWEGDNLLKGGFADLTHSIEEYVSIWNKKFERSKLSGTEEGDRPRIKYALDFAAKYTDGSGMAMNCIGGSVNTSNVVQLAISVAYSRQEALAGLGFGSCSSIANCGQTFSKEEYKQANLIAYEKTGPDPSPGTLASCDRFVATMMRATGVDENFPWGSTANQKQYLDSSPDWQKISCADRQPGDVLMWRPGAGGTYGHVMLYIGIVDGKDSIASASIALGRDGRSAQIRNISCRGELFNADGVNSQGYRKVK